MKVVPVWRQKLKRPCKNWRRKWIRSPINSRRRFCGIKWMKKILTLIALGVAVCSTPMPGFAQAERGEGAVAQPEETTFQLIARGANFVVLFGGLAYLLRKPMTEFFQTRRNEIASGLQRAQDAQETAQARMDQIDQRLAQLSADIAALRGEAERESRADREKVLVEAKRE